MRRGWILIITALCVTATCVATLLMMSLLSGGAETVAAAQPPDGAAAQGQKPTKPGKGHGRDKKRPPLTTTTTESTTTETSTTLPPTTVPSTTEPPTTETSTTLSPTTEASTTLPPTTEPDDSVTCPDGLESTKVIAGEQFTNYRSSDFADATLFDATTARWNGVDESGAPIHWVITLRAPDDDPNQGAGSCWDGGDYRGAWDENASDVSWEDPYHHSGAMIVDVPDFTVVNLHVDNQGDGIRTEDRGSNLRIHNVYLTDIHDDCVENDYLHNITITDSFFDGCYVAFSARTHSGIEGTFGDRSGNVWTIRNSLVRLEPQPTVYRGPVPGHGGIFKWDDGAPQVSLHDTVFRVDQNPNHGTIGIPSELEFQSCSNNTMVWLGDGEFPQPLPDCFTITTDRSVWDAAVAGWNGS